MPRKEVLTLVLPNLGASPDIRRVFDVGREAAAGAIEALPNWLDCVDTNAEFAAGLRQHARRLLEAADLAERTYEPPAPDADADGE